MCVDQTYLFFSFKNYYFHFWKRLGSVSGGADSVQSREYAANWRSYLQIRTFQWNKSITMIDYLGDSKCIYIYLFSCHQICCSWFMYPNFGLIVIILRAFFWCMQIKEINDSIWKLILDNFYYYIKS